MDSRAVDYTVRVVKTGFKQPLSAGKLELFTAKHVLLLFFVSSHRTFITLSCIYLAGGLVNV